MSELPHNARSVRPPSLLSVVIPIYNEKDTWRDLMSRVQAVQLPGGMKMQLVLVEDCSTDGTRQQVAELARSLETEHRGQAPIPARRDWSQSPGPPPVKVFFHDTNQGKGAALRTGFSACDGELVIVQDADLEYDPNDYPALVEPILAGKAQVVYGSRFLAGGAGGYLANFLANRILTGLSNMLTGLGLTDMETCYKVIPTSLLRRISIEQNRFGFEPEITAKIARAGLDILEVPISYRARTHEQGKKIGWKDGLKAMWCILKYGLKGR